MSFDEIFNTACTRTYYFDLRLPYVVSVLHYNNVIMSTIASQITSLTIVYSTVYSGADHRKHQSSASLAFVQGIHRRPVNSTHKGPVTRKIFSFDDVIMDVVWQKQAKTGAIAARHISNIVYELTWTAVEICFGTLLDCNFEAKLIDKCLRYLL